MNKQSATYLARVLLSLCLIMTVAVNTFGAGVVPARAQESTDMATTYKSNNQECYSLDLIVEDGEGVLESLTPQNCQNGYLSGTTIELKATPSEGYQVSGWSGIENVQSDQTNVAFVIEHNSIVEVYFSPAVRKAVEPQALTICSPNGLNGYTQMGGLSAFSIGTNYFPGAFGWFIRQTDGGSYQTLMPSATSGSQWSPGHVMSPDGNYEWVDVIFYLSNGQTYSSTDTFTLKFCVDGQTLIVADYIDVYVMNNSHAYYNNMINYYFQKIKNVSIGYIDQYSFVGFDHLTSNKINVDNENWYTVAFAATNRVGKLEVDHNSIFVRLFVTGNNQVDVGNIALLYNGTLIPSSAPGNVQASNETYTDQIWLTWNDVSSATFFEIWRGDCSNCIKTKKGFTSNLYYSDTDVTPGVAYYYAIYACTTSGCSSSGGSDWGTRRLASPTNVTATTTLSDKIRVTWTRPGPQTGFDVYRGESNDISWAQRVNTSVIPSTATSFDDPATPGIQYYYWVYAYNEYTTSLPSDPAIGYRTLSIPSAPTNASATTNLTDRVEITWTASSGATYYNIYRNTTNSSASAQIINTSNWPNSPYNDYSPTAGVPYYYWIRACNSAGCSTSFSNVAQGQKAVTVTAPLAPTNASATTNLTDRVEITWTASSGATYYNIYRNTTNSSASAQIINTSNWPNSPYNDYSPTAGVPYYYWIRACNSAGCSTSFSNVAQGQKAVTVTNHSPNTPNTPEPSHNAGDVPLSQILYWNGGDQDVGDTVTYQVYLKLSTDSSYSPFCSNYIEPYCFSSTVGLDYNKTYNWYVVATDNHGATSSSQSTPWTFTTRTSSTPSAPTNVTATTTLTDQVIISWTLSSGATYYDIYRNTSDFSGSAQRIATNWPNSPYSDNPPSVSIPYYYWVKACNSAGCSYYFSNVAQGQKASSGSAPVNDDFNNAFDITSLPFTPSPLDITLATTASDDPLLPNQNPSGTNYCGGSKKVQSVWYKYTPSSSGTLRIDTSGSNYETNMALFTGTRGALNLVDCGYIDPIEFNVVGNTTYYLEITSWDGTATTKILHLSISLTPVTTILYAAPSAVGSGNCSSWANACGLQTAITLATSGQQIWVKAGVHKPSTNLSDRSASFTLKNGVAIYGGFSGSEGALNLRDLVKNTTVLSGDIDNNDINSDGNFINETTSQIQGNNSYHVVNGGGANATAVLDGFIITGGQANGTGNQDWGGGMLNENSNPSLSNLIFQGNLGLWGGGMQNDNSNPTLTNIIFSNNSATNNGGGMYNYYSSPMLTNSTFRANSAGFYGGGIDNYSSSPTLSDVTFTGNSSYAGGGMFNSSGSSPYLTNSVFSGNSAYVGGGIYSSIGSNPTLRNVTLNRNSATTDGGALYNFNNSNPILVNSILWGNTSANGNQIYNSTAQPLISYSDIQGCGGSFDWNSACGTNGGNNIDSDPRFLDADGADNLVGTLDDNLRLIFGSPVLDRGTNTNCPSTDLDGAVRPQDDNQDGIATCEMGAYEGAQPDNVAPAVESITRIDPNPTTAASVNYRVTFREEVSGVNPSDFTVTQSGVTGAGISSVTPVTSSVYIITVNTGNGNGTIRLDLIDNDSILDMSGNPLGGIGLGNGNFTTGELYDVIRVTITPFTSSSTYDGWILEYSETSNTGGTLNTTGATFNLGDDSMDRQYRSILHFDTSGLPDNAIITKVTLKLKLQGVTGTNPFTTHGNLLLDIIKGAFGGINTLAKTDFKAAPGLSSAAIIPNLPDSGNWYSVNLGSNAFPFLNLTGVTQFRLRFTLDDNDDRGADFIKFYSGNSTTASFRPTLLIEYYLP